MLANQVHSILASFLQTCQCKISNNVKLSDVGLEGDKLRNFKNLLQHHYSSTFESQYKSWIIVDDIVKDVEKNVMSL